MYWSLLSTLEELIKVLGACTLRNNYIFNCVVVLVSHLGLTGYCDMIPCLHFHYPHSYRSNPNKSYVHIL